MAIGVLFFVFGGLLAVAGVYGVIRNAALGPPAGRSGQQIYANAGASILIGLGLVIFELW